MLYGLYQSAQGVQAQTARIDVVANNLANASTSGFKRDLAIFQSARPFDVENGVGTQPPGNQHALSGGISPAKVFTDFTTGPLTRTGGQLDLALNGSGFFQVSDGRQQYLTRQGQFMVGQGGELVTHGTGMRVLSNAGGPINIPSESTAIEIGNDGTVTSVAGDGGRSQIGKLGLVRPAAEQQLEKIGNALFRAPASVSPAGSDVQVQQGYLEASGSNPVSEMIALIQASRAVEANVNMIKYQDDALERLLQSATPH